jgi:T4 bacteriophage base plate protein
MPFKLNAYLPSKQTEVQIKELYYKQYRELVKSLYNTDKKETIQQYNSILQDLCSDIVDKDITFEDKLSLLLTIRNYCISPDLRLKGTLSDGGTFNYSITVEELIKKVKNINKSTSLQYNNITIEMSSYKIRDEHIFLSNNKDIFVVLASYIDTIKVENELVIFKDLTMDERLRVVESLPYALVTDLTKVIENKENEYEVFDLLSVPNPVTKQPVLRLSCNITYEVLQKCIELLFTENLNNVYRAFYNMIKFAGFDPNYIDKITPVELQVYWMYYMQDIQKVESEKSANTKSGGLNMPMTPNTELGF